MLTTMPITNCLLVGALCFALCSLIVPALIVVVVSFVLEFTRPAVGAANVRANAPQTD